MKRRLNLLRNENGYTLIIVIMVLVIISILGLGLMGTSATTLKQSDNERIDQATYYIAEAGLVQKKTEINFDKIAKKAYSDTLVDYNSFINNLEKTGLKSGDFNPNTVFLNHVEQYINSIEISSEYNNFEDNFGKHPKATVNFLQPIRTQKTLTYTLNSVGTIGTHSSRNVHQQFIIGLNNESEFNSEKIVDYSNPYSLHVSSGITLNGQAGDISNIATSLDVNSFISQSKGNDFLNQVQQNNNTMHFNQRLPKMPEFPTNEFNISFSNRECSNPQNCTFSDESIYNSINLTNQTINVDVGDVDKKIIVKDINLNNSNININKKGNGKLRIYVVGNISVDTTSSINSLSKNVSQLLIYYKGGQFNNINGNIYGSIDTGNYNLNNENIFNFKGNIYTRFQTDINQTISFNHSNSIDFPQILFAPNSSITFNGATFYGAIIAKSFIGDGNPSRVNFSKIAPVEIIEPDQPSNEPGKLVLISPVVEK